MNFRPSSTNEQNTELSDADGTVSLRRGQAGANGPARDALGVENGPHTRRHPAGRRTGGGPTTPTVPARARSGDPRKKQKAKAARRRRVGRAGSTPDGKDVRRDHTLRTSDVNSAPQSFPILWWCHVSTRCPHFEGQPVFVDSKDVDSSFYRQGLNFSKVLPLNLYAPPLCVPSHKTP